MVNNDFKHKGGTKTIVTTVILTKKNNRDMMGNH